MRYISDDNKVFNSEQECLAHENKQREENDKWEKFLNKKGARLKEVKSAYDNFVELYAKYSKDYHEYGALNKDLDLDVLAQMISDCYDYGFRNFI